MPLTRKQLFPCSKIRAEPSIDPVGLFPVSLPPGSPLAEMRVSCKAIYPFFTAGPWRIGFPSVWYPHQDKEAEYASPNKSFVSFPGVWKLPADAEICRLGPVQQDYRDACLVQPGGEKIENLLRLTKRSTL